MGREREPGQGSRGALGREEWRHPAPVSPGGRAFQPPGPPQWPGDRTQRAERGSVALESTREGALFFAIGYLRGAGRSSAALEAALDPENEAHVVSEAARRVAEGALERATDLSKVAGDPPDALRESFMVLIDWLESEVVISETTRDYVRGL